MLDAMCVKFTPVRVDAFDSGEYGILGAIDTDYVVWNRRPEATIKLRIPQKLANVHICKVYTGMTEANFRFINEVETDGLVIAFGRGNMPPNLVPFIRQTVDRGIPVVVTSRCIYGNTAPTYGYPGGGADLEKAGAWFAQDLSTEKVRLLMSVALGLGLSKGELREVIYQRGISPER